MSGHGHVFPRDDGNRARCGGPGLCPSCARDALLAKSVPKEGQQIEFLSDKLTDKGPSSGRIDGMKTTVDGLYVTVKFSDSQEMFSWDDLVDAGIDLRGNLWMVKAHIKGYSKKDGTYVRPHERDTGIPHSKHPEPVHHPQAGENGEAVKIHEPHHSSAPSTWHSPDAVATFIPNGDAPASLNGIPIRAWKDIPQSIEGWDYLEDCINEDLVEPPFRLPSGKKAAAGVVIEEPDGRCWIVHPTNAFGGYEASWPKGTADQELSLQGTAVKEAFEETGLKIAITGFIGDFERTTSVARMYRAKRIGGDPTRAGWEAQGVSLIPKGLLYEHLNMVTDHGIAEAVGAGPAPKTPQQPPKFADFFGKLFK
jgi:ADP-ribose pyrophosphatase YjhB (NUDIX family)